MEAFFFSLKLYTYILLSLISFQVVAQELNVKSLKSDSKEVLIAFNSIEHVELRTSVENQKFSITYQNTDESNAPVLFEDQGSVHIKVPNKSNILPGAEKNKYRAGQPIFPKYSIVIPNNSSVQLFYDKGNAKITNLVGNLDLHISSGTVDIDQFKGTVKVTTFSGKINCAINEASLDVITNNGVINSLLDDESLVEDEHSLKGIYKNANNVLNIRTIHAKVTLKPIVTRK